MTAGNGKTPQAKDDEVKTPQFKLTSDEKRQILAQRIKDLEVQRFNAEVSLQLLETMSEMEGVAAQQEQEEKKIKQADRVLGELLRMHAALDETEVLL